MKKTRTFRFINYGIIAAIIVIVSTFTFMRPVFILKKPQDAILTITATGQKEDSSFGTEVRIQSIKVNQSQDIDLKEFVDFPGWQMDGDLLAAYNVKKPVRFSVQLRFTSLDINMIRQRGSGIVEIEIEDKKESISLYANEDWNEEQWHYEVPGEFKPFTRVDLLIGLWFVVFLIIWGVFYWASSK